MAQNNATRLTRNDKVSGPSKPRPDEDKRGHPRSREIRTIQNIGARDGIALEEIFLLGQDFLGVTRLAKTQRPTVGFFYGECQEMSGPRCHPIGILKMVICRPAVPLILQGINRGASDKGFSCITRARKFQRRWQRLDTKTKPKHFKSGGSHGPCTNFDKVPRGRGTGIASAMVSNARHLDGARFSAGHYARARERRGFVRP